MPGKTIVHIPANADEPIRENYDTDEEFEKAHSEWVEAQKGPFPNRVVPEQDLVTGPYFDEELRRKADDAYVNEGPGVAPKFVNEGPGAVTEE